MRILALDGFVEASALAAAASAALEREAGERGLQIEFVRPADLASASCTGCFECWDGTPGVCVQRDSHPSILRAILRADLILLLTPITFGGYSPELKIVFDRGIPLLLPFFRTVGGEVHHPMRYDRSRSLAALGVLTAADPEAEAVFEAVVRRNAVNFDARPVAVRAVTEDILPGALGDVLGGLLDEVRRPLSARQAIARLPDSLWVADRAVRLPLPARGAPRRATLLIGSPRSPSNSASLGGHLIGRLGGLGWETSVHRVPSSGRPGDWMDAATAADLIVVATPLYADALPTHLVRALMALSDALRAESPRQRGLAGIVNCGFPEAHNNHTALAVLRLFARDTGLAWLGGLPMGMGEMVDRAPLAQRGGMVRGVIEALDAGAEALDGGRPVPEEAINKISRQVVPRWMYILGGNWGWRSRGRKKGAGDLKARPLETKD